MIIQFFFLNLYFLKHTYMTFITKSCSCLSLYFSGLHGKAKDFFDIVENDIKTLKSIVLQPSEIFVLKI